MQVTWHSFDLRSGRRGQQVATRQAGSFGRTVSAATETTIDVRVLAGWDEATLPGRVMLVALDATTEEPLWGGMVYRRTSSKDTWVSVQAITVEAYFDRRYVKDRTFTQTEQGLIARGLILDTVTDGIDLAVQVTPSTQFRDRTYLDDEDKTVLSVLGELAGVEDGIEFTVNLSWVDDTHTQLRRTVLIAPRIGTASSTPSARFDMPGCVTDFTYVEDYSTEHGANAVQATSSAAEADQARPESAWQTMRGLFAAGWATFERRIQPSTSITDVATLNQHALAELQQTWDGLNELTLTARQDHAPVIGTDWHLGDDVTVTLTCPRFPDRLNADGALVPGYQAVVRSTAWAVDLDADTLTPTLLELNPVEVEKL